MNWQNFITTLLVCGCTAYAAWRLMPAGWRRQVLTSLGRPVPASGPCGGCDNCGDKPAAATAPGTAVIKIVRRARGASTR
jgi:hypothetical protein